MRIGIKMPMRYLQEAGIRRELGKYAAQFGKKAVVVASRRSIAQMGDEIKSYLAAEGCDCIFSQFGGDSTQPELDKVEALVRENGADMVIGFGGGKVLDTARGAAAQAGVSLIIVPTSASNDSPCSALVIVHDENGAVIDRRIVPSNPDLVLVDTELIAKAPAKLLASGIGDALATYYEARACFESGAESFSGGISGVTALALAKTCRDTLFQYGPEAIESLKSGEVTPALEQLVHAAIFLSGVGFENGGTAASHSINDGFSALPRCKELLHGQLVGFGVLVQLELEKAPAEEKNDVRRLMAMVGLPTTLEALGLGDISEEELRIVAQESCAAPIMANMPFPVSVDDVYAAILSADAYSRENA